MKFIRMALARGVPALGAIFFNIYVASQLTVDDADIFFFWFSILYILSFLGRLGFDTYVLRALDAHGEFSAAACKRAALIASVLLAAGAIFFAPREVQWLLFSLPAFSLVGINSSVLRAQGKDSLGGIFEISLLSLVALGVIIVGDLTGSGIALAQVSEGFAVASIGVFIVSEFIVGRCHSVFGRGAWLSPDISTGLRFVPSPLMIYITQWVAIFFLSGAGAGAVSIYSIAVRLASGFAFIAITIDAFVAPRFARYFREGDRDSISALISSVRRKSILILGGFFIIYAGMGRYLVVTSIGVDYVESFYVSLVVAMSYCLILFIGPYQYCLLMGGLEQKVNMCNGFSFLLVAFGSLLLWHFGVESVSAYAAVVAASRLVGILLMRYFSLKIIARL